MGGQGGGSAGNELASDTYIVEVESAGAPMRTSTILFFWPYDEPYN